MYYCAALSAQKKLPVVHTTFRNNSGCPPKAAEASTAKELADQSTSSTIVNDSQDLAQKAVNFLPTSKPEAPKPRRKGRKKRKQERGLPDEKARLDLARTYLEIQTKCWPELVKSGILPRASKKTIKRLADNFRQRFLGGAVEEVESVVAGASEELGGAYLRYSCDNSNPRSLDQQLRNALQRARSDEVFIPWQWVMADAAVTGTIASRSGYQMAKSLIASGHNGFGRLYIDELGRAARDAIEALRLGRLVDSQKKRLIGVTDGFDSWTPYAKLMLTVFAMLHELFVDQLKSKVLRGMADAFEQGRNINPPSFGYKLVPATDADGNPIYDHEGDPIKAKVIDKEEAQWVVEVFRLFAEERRSPERIARHLNELAVGGKETWDRRRIVMILTRHTYVGVEYYGMTRQIRDPDNGNVTVVKRPRKEWKRREVPHLRVVSDEMWAKAHARLKQCSEAYNSNRKNRPTRTEVYPKALFRPICGYCENELWLGRSGKYASFCCLNGRDGKKGCKLRSYKSVRIIDNAILGHLCKHVFTQESLQTLLAAANRFLVEEAQRPREDTTPLRDQIKALEGKVERLTETIEDCGRAGLDRLVKRLRRHEKQLRALRRKLKQIEARDAAPPPPITEVDLEAILSDLRGLLSADVEAVAPVLKELTGDIMVTQVREKGKHGATWIARFTINSVPVVAELTARRGCPTSGTWEFLNTRGWTIPIEAEVRLEEIPGYELLAPEMLAMYRKVRCVQTVASAYGISRMRTKEILDFARTGKRPKWKAGKRTGTGIRVDYRKIAPFVAKWRDEEHLTWRRIADRLVEERVTDRRLSEDTLRRAYDYFHQETVREAARHGRKTKRGG